jgi:HSP20 family molecular chaperone IbpA
VVKVELPGMDEKDVEVLLSDDALTIRAKRRRRRRTKARISTMWRGVSAPSSG